MKIVVSVNVSLNTTEIYFFYWLLVASLAISIAVPVVFSLTLTSLAGVLLKNTARFKGDEQLHITLFMFIPTRNSQHCKFGACQNWEPAGRISDFGNFLNGFAKSPLLPCIPHRSRLFWLKSPDIMEFSSWKIFIMWSILYNLLCKGSACFVCLAKFWKTAVCPRSVW